MNFRHLNLEIKDRIGIVTVNFPPANSLAPEVRDELFSALKQVAQDTKIWTAILTGAGDKFFMAGANIPSLLRLDRCQALERARIARELFDFISKGEKPVIAAINGMCLGGGLELALSCDIRIAAEHSQFGFPEVGLGIMPGGGGTQRLPRIVGTGLARYLIFTGERISAEKAFQIGLVEQVIPYPDLLQAALTVAKKINQQSPLGVRAAKKAIRESNELSLGKGLDLENELWADLFKNKDKDEGIRAFLEKRKPSFQAK
jgi:enoyl-CoA hydratase